MKRAWNQLFLSHRLLSRRGLADRHGTVFARPRPQTCRHPAWVQAVMARFLHRAALHGTAQEKLIHLLALWRSSLFFRNLRPQIHLSVHGLLQQFFSRGHTAVLRRAFVQGGPQQHAQTAPGSRLPQTPNGTALAFSAGATGGEPTAGLSPVESIVRRSGPVLVSFLPAMSALVRLRREVITRLHRDVITRGRSTRRETVETDSNPNDIVKRITWQVRRVDENPLPLQRNLVLHLAPIPTSGSDLTLSHTRPATWSEYSGEAATAISPFQSAVNLTQLTDEVVRQLDRRLVAARERMGRI